MGWGDGWDVAMIEWLKDRMNSDMMLRMTISACIGIAVGCFVLAILYLFEGG